MGRKFSDNALTTLASSILAGSTTLTVAAGKGDNFPAVVGHGTPGSTPDYFVITLEDASGNIEKIRVEQRASGSDALGSVGFPLVRGYDGTAARGWNAGDSVDLRVDHSMVQDAADKIDAARRDFGVKASATTGLNFGYYGANLLVDGVPTTIADGTLVLTALQTNYVERTPAGAVSSNTTGFSADKIPLYQVTTDASGISTITDQRQNNLPQFGLASVSIAGGAGDQVATADQARAVIIELTGAITGNRGFVLPNLKRPWLIYNNTTGAFTVTIKVTGQPGTAITQGKHQIVYGNGTDIVPGFNDIPTIPPGTPAGVMSDFGGTVVPSGYLACDGSNVSRATYAALFTAIGTTWGAGDGSTTFTLPDSRRRVSVGSGGAATGTLGNTVGSVGGEETHTLSTGEMPAHTHPVQGAQNVGAGNGYASTTVNNGGVQFNTESTGGGGAHNNMQPSMVVTKIIKT